MRTRKLMQRTSDPASRENLRIRYRSEIRNYKRHVGEARRSSWSKFLTEQGDRAPWGIGYKSVSGKVNAESVVRTMEVEGGRTVDYRQTLEALLHGLIPDDGPDEEEYSIRKRQEMSVLPASGLDPSFLIEEATRMLAKMKRKKSPGLDGILVDMVSRVWHIIGPDFVWLVNTALEHSVFPDLWKEGEVVALLKKGERQAGHPASYRPICLLPVLGKLAEGMLIERIMDRYRLAPNQFGFVRGKSTEDALLSAVEVVKNSGEKYVLGILIDIKSAFDNVWWPYLLGVLKESYCPKNLYALLLDYFRNRKVVMRSRTLRVTKSVTKGCPQGSVMGPHLWNITFKEAVESVSWAREHKIAFADDLLIIVEGCSRQQLQEKGCAALAVITDWGTKSRLQLSPEKSSMILLKGRLDIRRPPVIRIGGVSLKLQKEVKYLGVLIEERMGFNLHTREVGKKAKAVFAKLSRLSRANWGYKASAMLVLYRSIVVPMMTYAAVVWADCINAHGRRNLLVAQRSALRSVAQAYSTVPGEGLQTLLGTMPLDIEARARAANTWIRKRKGFVLGEDVWTTDRVRNDPRAAVLAISNFYNREWQVRWDSSVNGRWTYKFMPIVSNKCRLSVNHEVCQMITGHGDFRAYLKRFGLTEEDGCVCGGVETAEHLLVECPVYDRQRFELRSELNRISGSEEWPPNYVEFVSPQCARFFVAFVKRVMRMKALRGNRT